MFKKILLSSFIGFLSVNTFAGVVDETLYWSGNSSSPRMENVREGDVETFIGKDGKIWVKGMTKGISTTKKLPSPPKNWWKIPAGTSYPSKLTVIKDGKDHRSWAPTQDMPLDEYKKALQSVNSKFQKLQ